MQKQLICSGTKWEDIVGYSRPVRVGNIVEVAGTTAMDGDQLVGKDDVYAQSKFIFEKIEKALHQARTFSLKSLSCTQKILNQVQNDGSFLGFGICSFFT